MAKPKKLTKEHQALYKRIEKLVLERAASAHESGKRFERGSWANKLEGHVCAVGAIIFNGDPIKVRGKDSAISHYQAYVLGAKQLKEIDVPDDLIGFVLDAISEGFENDKGCGLLNQYANRGGGERKKPLYAQSLRELELYEKLFDLGKTVYEKYVGEDYDYSF
jgi:hypothetical protein